MKTNRPLWLLLISILALSSMGTALAAAPDAWLSHDDPLGFFVQHPPNWTAEIVQDELIAVHNADSAMFALVQPFFARDGVTAAGWIGEVPAKLQTVFPNAMVNDIQQVSYQPDEVVAELAFDNHGEAGRALLLCVIDERSGMLYAIAAPDRTFDKVRGVLVDILGTFTFTTPTARPPDLGGVTYVKWQDPNENAFTLEVPQSWPVSGGLYRMHAVDVRPDVQINSPDGQMFFRIGDQNIPPYTIPNWTLEVAGFTEGSWYSYMGMTWMVRNYVTGLDFAREYLLQNLPAGCTDVNIASEQDRTDLSQPVNDIYSHYNLYGGSITLSIGEVIAQCQQAEKPLLIYCLAGTKLATPPSSGPGIWNVEYLVYGAVPAAEGDTAKAILGHIVNSYEINPDWMIRQSELAGTVGDIVAQTGAEIREIMRQAFEAESETRYNAARRWSNMILGMTDVRDPATGEEWRIANGHNYYWRKGDTIVGTDIDRPSVEFTPLVEF